MNFVFLKKIKKLESFNTDIPAFFFFVLLISIIYSSGCTKADQFAVGRQFVTPSTDLILIDTIEAEMSTVLLDSIITLGTGVAIVGTFRDTIFGFIKSTGYFEPGYNISAFKSNEDAIFDSATFIFTFSKYYFGDTTATMKLSVHQLKEEMILDDETQKLYNTSSFDYDPVPLGTKLFLPEPDFNDSTLRIRADEFGKKIFDLIQNNSEDFDDAEAFINYIKGFVLVSDDGYDKTVFGFRTGETDTLLNIYYHLKKVPVLEDVSIPIFFSDRGKQFNSIIYNYPDPELDSLLKTNRRELPSYLTGNRAFLQGLVGLVPKVRFPGLANLLSSERSKVLRAELVIEPVKGSYVDYDLPQTLYCNETTIENLVGDPVKNVQGNEVASTLYYDRMFNEDTGYTIDLSEYIISELSVSEVDPENGILINLKGAAQNASLNRMLVENNERTTKLRIYYLSY